ncbi:hypothetical protein [Sphingomonas sp.]|uniref:hypothetical protein n=1 Tax=Sphingomonas sp. TaxID=28214 RepID=UPI001D760246|nr:hypothetical protein [Sphingomonas sp.]MBX9796235.1 hypothetical protein [Sphingomonas sp.]
MRRVLALLTLVLTAAEKPPQAAPRPLPRSIDGLPIGAIPPQEMPATGCAAFLWTNTTTRSLAAMLTTEPPRARLAPGGMIVDLVRTEQSGGGNYGFTTHGDYAAGDYRVAVDIEIVERGDLTQGAIIPAGTMRFEKEGSDGVVVPVVGIIGCAQ